MAKAAIPPAFVAELIDDVGAYAGIAAIVGLAVLSLLYFTQAREVKRLREWAGRAPEREAELAARVRAEAMRQRTSAAPGVPRPAGNGQQAPRAVQPPGVPAAPPPPVVPPPGKGATSGQPPTVVPALATAAARPPSPEAAVTQARGATPGDGGPTTQAADAQHTQDSPVPGTGTAAAGGGGGAGGAPSAQGAAPLARTTAPSRAVSPRGPRPRTPPPPPVGGDGDGQGTRMIGLIIGGALAAVVVGVLLITQVFGGGDEAQQPAAPSNSAAPAQAPPGEEGPPPRGEVNVAVLNGTTVAGLAVTIAAELEQSGFQRGEVATNVADQTLTETTVQFAEGSRESALEVAEVLGLDEEAVEPLERNTRVAAGEEAAVVVLVGNDGVGNPAGAESGGGGTEGTGDAVTP